MMIALQSLVSLALLLCALRLLSQYRVDQFREDIFALREALFLDAAEGKIAFTSHGYRYARAVLNGMVRFAHEISMLDFLAFKLIVPKAAVRQRQESVKVVFSSMSEADRKLCQAYLAMAHRLVIKHLASAPIVAVTLVVPLALLVLTAVGIDWIAYVVEKFKGPIRSLDALAVAEGRANNGAAACA